GRTRGGHGREEQPVARARASRRRRPRRRTRPRVGRLVVGRAARPTYAAGVGGRRPGRPGPDLRRDREAPVHHPVRGEPACRGRGHRGGAPGPRARGIPRPHRTRRCSMTVHEAGVTALVAIAAALSVAGLMTGKAPRAVAGGSVVLLLLALLIGWSTDSGDD